MSVARKDGSKTTAEEHCRPVREAGCRLGFSREEIAESNELLALMKGRYGRVIGVEILGRQNQRFR